MTLPKNLGSRLFIQFCCLKPIRNLERNWIHFVIYTILNWYIYLGYSTVRKYWTNFVCKIAQHCQWVVGCLHISRVNHINTMSMLFSWCWLVDLLVEQLCKCCQHMSDTRNMKHFHYSLHRTFTINTAKPLTSTQ